MDYRKRHFAARTSPTNKAERAWNAAIDALQRLADLHVETIGDDYVARDPFLDAARGVHGLIECLDLGRLDAGIIQDEIQTILLTHGYHAGELYGDEDPAE